MSLDGKTLRLRSRGGALKAPPLAGLLVELEAQALDDLRVAGLGAGDIDFQRYLAICYPGQTFDLAVKDRKHLDAVMKKLSKLKGILSVERLRG